MLAAHNPNNALDPCFGNPEIVLHFEAPNGSTTCIDNSTNARTFTRVGSTPVISTANKRFGTSSASFNGTSAHWFETPNFTGVNLEAVEFTVEAWIYRNTSGTGIRHSICGVRPVSGSGGWGFEILDDKLFLYYAGQAGSAVSTTSIVAGQWYHVAGVRVGSTLYVYVNGVREGSYITEGNGTADVSSTFKVGAVNNSTGPLFNGYIDELIVWKGVARYTEDFVPQAYPRPGPTHPIPNLLMHMNGTAASTTFIDSSVSAKAITTVGNASHSSTESKFNGTSAFFDGNGDYLTSPLNADFDFGSGDFTIETWVNFSTSNTVKTIACYLNPAVTNTSSGAAWLLDCFVSVNSVFRFAAVVGGVPIEVQGTTTPNLNQWYHVAVTRSGTTLRLFVDGVLEATATISGSIQAPASRIFQIGKLTTSNQGVETLFRWMSGYLQEMVVWKGFCKYTGNFEIPQTPYGTGRAPSTALLLQMMGGEGSQTFEDGSTYGRAVTRTGNTALTSTNGLPFNDVGDRAVIFDGSGDYLSFADSIISLTDSWTIESWMRPGAQGTPKYIGSLYTNTGGGGPADWASGRLIVGMTSDNRLFIQIGTVNVSGTTTVNSNQWHHVAWVRDGMVVRGYLDGNLELENAYNAVTLQNAVFRIGTVVLSNVATDFYTGMIDDYRITLNHARYDGNFSRPAERLSGSTIIATKALLHFNGTDASTSFIDQTGRTWTAVGNAQIDTADSRFGGASAQFDGSGDYITTTNFGGFDFGSDDFTIEFWAKNNNTSTYHNFISKRANSDSFGPFVLLRTNLDKAQLALSTNGASWAVNTIGTTSIGAGWHHYAIVRSGTNVSLYLDGILEISQSLTGALVVNSNNVYVGGEPAGSVTRYMNGWVDELRITKGVALYTSNFTPPASEFTYP